MEDARAAAAGAGEGGGLPGTYSTAFFPMMYLTRNYVKEQKNNYVKQGSVFDRRWWECTVYNIMLVGHQPLASDGRAYWFHAFSMIYGYIMRPRIFFQSAVL